MHFSTIIAFVMGLTLTVSISTVSAQEISNSCNVCFLKAAIIASPTCDYKMIIDSLPAANSLTPEQQTCLCPLADNDAWTRSCVKPGACFAADATLIYGGYSNIKGSKPCAAVAAFVPTPTPTQPPVGVTLGTSASPANEAGSLMGYASSKALAGTAVVVASIFVFFL